MFKITHNLDDIPRALNEFMTRAVKQARQSAIAKHGAAASRSRPAAMGNTPPPMVAVVSSDLQSVGYDGVARRLHIRFHSRLRPYVYLAVPVEVYGALMGAHSKGTYFHANIKPRFQCIK